MMMAMLRGIWSTGTSSRLAVFASFWSVTFIGTVYHPPPSPGRPRESVFLDDRLGPLGTNADHLHRPSDDLLDAPDVAACGSRQSAEGRRVTEFLLPTRQALVDGLGLGQPVDIGREERRLLAVDFVGLADVQLFQAGQGVE